MHNQFNLAHEIHQRDAVRLRHFLQTIQQANGRIVRGGGSFVQCRRACCIQQQEIGKRAAYVNANTKHYEIADCG